MYIFCSYRDGNYKLAQVTYKNIPTWLQHRPVWFIELTMRRLSKATSIQPDQIRPLPHCGQYNVKGYLVDVSLPSCECMDFRKNSFWCKHVLCLATSGHIQVENLPACSLNHPLITADIGYLRSIDSSISLKTDISSSSVPNSSAGTNQSSLTKQISFRPIWTVSRNVSLSHLI